MFRYLLLSFIILSAFQEADESLNFEEQILEAARAITGAASALVKAAASAQRELVASGRVCIYLPLHSHCVYHRHLN